MAVATVRALCHSTRGRSTSPAARDTDRKRGRPPWSTRPSSSAIWGATRRCASRPAAAPSPSSPLPPPRSGPTSRGRNKRRPSGTTSSCGESRPRPAASTSPRAGRCSSRAASPTAATTTRTATSATSPRSSRATSASSAAAAVAAAVAAAARDQGFSAPAGEDGPGGGRRAGRRHPVLTRPTARSFTPPGGRSVAAPEWPSKLRSFAQGGTDPRAIAVSGGMIAAEHHGCAAPSRSRVACRATPAPQPAARPAGSRARCRCPAAADRTLPRRADRRGAAARCDRRCAPTKSAARSRSTCVGVDGSAARTRST